MTVNLRVGASQSELIPFQDDQGHSSPDYWAAQFADYVPNSAMLGVSKCSFSVETHMNQTASHINWTYFDVLPDPYRGASYETRACSWEWLLNPNALWYGLQASALCASLSVWWKKILALIIDLRTSLSSWMCWCALVKKAAGFMALDARDGARRPSRRNAGVACMLIVSAALIFIGPCSTHAVLGDFVCVVR